MIRFLLTNIFLFIALTALSQVTTLKGTVIDEETGQTLPFCNVFISNTTLGTTTDINGDFSLINVPETSVEIGFSFVGYISLQKQMTLKAGTENFIEVSLTALKQQLSEVEIQSSRDKEWEKLQRRFSKLFLGSDKLAASCEIVNPWIVDFKEKKDDKALTATANQPIEIKNKALGYYLNFDLKEFTATTTSYKIVGPVRFSEMDTDDPALASVWEKNRREVYLRSINNLLQSIAENKLASSSFKLYTDNPDNPFSTSYRSDIFNNELGKTVIEYKPDTLVEKDIISGNYKVFLKGRVEAHYQNGYSQTNTYKDAPYPVSWIEVDGGVVHMSKNFNILNPEDITISGDMDNKRVSSMLPLDYNPSQKVVTKGKMVISDAERLLEKVYIHTDRNYYYAGDQVLFKGYMYYNTPSIRDSLSKILYVDLIDPNKKIIATNKYKIENGFAIGDIFLSDTLSQINYTLRAYTSWMRNYGDEIYFVKSLPILDLKQRIKTDEKYNLSETQGSEKLTITSDKTSFAKREKITLSISVTDSLGQPLASNLSISITNTHFANPTFNQTSIKDWYINNYPDLNLNKKVFNFPIEKSLSFKGIFFGEKKKPKFTKFQAFLNNFSGVLDLETDKNGIFQLSDMYFFGKMDIALQAKNKKNENYGYFELYKPNHPFIDIKPALSNDKLINIGQPIYINDMNAGVTILDEVTVASAREVEFRDNVYGRPDYTVTADKLNTNGSVDDLMMSLKGLVPSILITTAWNGFTYTQQIRIRGGAPSLLLSMEPMVIINGVPKQGGTAFDNLRSLNPAEIDRIEVVTRMNSAVGDLGRNGVISIFLNNKINRDFGMQQNNSASLSTFQIEGLSNPNFISFPNYERNSEELQPKYDQRPTLYWNPLIVTDTENGNVQIPFFTNDIISPIYVLVEGTSINGTALRGSYLINP